MSQPSQLPATPGSLPNSSGVRRHHTISAASRAARNSAISEEAAQEQHWNDDDEAVGEDWVGGVGAVGEKSGLHRQASLPTRYHRAFQPQVSALSRSGSLTAKNSLSAIAGHEGDEDDWEGDIPYAVDDSHVTGEELDPNSPLSPHDGPSPPAAGAGVRRHQSLTYGAAARQAQKVPVTGLRRSGTLQTPLPPHPPPANATEALEQEQEEFVYQDDPGDFDESEYYPKQAGPASPVNRLSPWSTNGGDWRAPNNGFAPTNVDDVQRALSALEIGAGYAGNGNAYVGGQSTHPPRFNPAHPPPAQAPGMRSAGGGNGNGNSGNGNGGRKVGEFDGRKTPVGQQQQQSGPPYQPYSGAWDQQKDPSLRLRTSNPNLRYSYQQQQTSKDQPVPPIPAQYMQPPRPTQQNFGGSPVDVPSLIAAKGYNPATFELRPQYARYFVIKSYTEDDVHKSLKYEIWSSTEPGNKRLDKAFKECNGRGPIYLFFSVNASGHFCGMAEMLTAVDYTRSSTVWASDKWKGVFKVRWIYVRDIPNLNLRHIKLMNTAERKPVTNSRDTQELLAEAGQEMLRIIHTHPARTSLLQDFAFYELQAMQKVAQGSPSPGSPTSSAGAPTHSPQMSPPMAPAQFPLNPNAFMVPQMTPMVQMQLMGMNMGMGAASSQFQAMHQSVMRHPSPGPSGEGFGHNGF